jgi:hypothetical protein
MQQFAASFFYAENINVWKQTKNKRSKKNKQN